MLCISAFPHFHISAYVSEFLYFRAAQCLHAYICMLLCFRIFALQNFADVRRCSQIFVDSCNSFMDFRRCSACLPFCNSVFIHFGICQNPWESIDWNPSGGSGQESRNEIISDLSLAMFLAHLLLVFPGWDPHDIDVHKQKPDACSQWRL